MIRAKLKCEQVTKLATQETVLFTAAAGPGNEVWSKYTPGANLSMTVTNPECFGKFNPGQFYFLDFTPEAQ